MKNKKNCFILGTRPTVIKFAPLIKKMDSFVIHTGQHSSLANDMFKIFDIEPDINLKLMTKNQSLNEFLSKCIKKLDKVIKENNIERIWVHGDTSSALAGALVATTNQIQLVHNEAGLRSHDKKNPFPEETFRTLIDSMSDVLFATSKRAVDNLKNENVQGKIHLVGNTVIDSLKMIERKLPNVRPIEDKYILATVHRRESFGNDLYEIFSALKELSKEIKIILPAHPNPNVQKMLMKVGLETVKPMNYLDFLWHLKHCEYAISDSGGVQEEACSFKKKIIVLRKETERQEIIELGYGILIRKMKRKYILQEVKKFIKKDITFGDNPYGTGHTADKIIRVMQKIK